jgi:hypothetical protein
MYSYRTKEKAVIDRLDPEYFTSCGDRGNFPLLYGNVTDIIRIEGQYTKLDLLQFANDPAAITEENGILYFLCKTGN